MCNGSGWVAHRVPLGHPDHGEVFPCRCQETVSQENRLSQLLRYSNVGPLQRNSFETTRPEGRLPGPQSKVLFGEAFKAAARFAEEPQGWLVLTGPSGSGKTHLAAAIANRCIERGRTVLFAFVPDLLDHLRGTYTPQSDVSYDDLSQQVRTAPVLVLDDLGSHSSSPWAQEKLFQVINHRFNSMLPTVFTVRGPLERLDEGIRTRLEAMDVSLIYSVGHPVSNLFEEKLGLTGDMLERMTFESFKTGREVRATQQERETLAFAYETARGFAESPQGWLLLTGLNGCGKTHLAVSIINVRRRLGQPVLFASVPTLLDHLRAAFRPDSLTGYDELFEQVKTVPLLVLDDLGAERSTPWAEEKLYQLIVHRHNPGLPTVITTYYESLNELEKAKPRIRSRLSDSLVEWAPILAPDYRDQRPSSGPGAGARRSGA